MPASAILTLPPEHIHFEAAGYDRTLPGHVLRLPLADGRVLVCHMNTETAERLRLEHAEPGQSELPCTRFCCRQARALAMRGAA